MRNRITFVILGTLFISGCCRRVLTLPPSSSFSFQALRTDWSITDFQAYMQRKYAKLDTSHIDRAASSPIVITDRLGQHVYHDTAYAFTEWTYRQVRIEDFPSPFRLRVLSDMEGTVRSIELRSTIDSASIAPIYFGAFQKLVDRFGPHRSWEYVPLTMEYDQGILEIQYLTFDAGNFDVMLVPSRDRPLYREHLEPRILVR